MLRIRPDGGLTPVAGRRPVGSGGIEPVSIAVHAWHRLRRQRRRAAAVNYTGFRLDWGGRPAAHRPARPSALPDAAQPGDVLFNSTGTELVGTRVGDLADRQLHRRLATVGCTRAPGSPFAAQGPGPFGSEFRPTDPDQLFVSNAHGGADAGTVSAFDEGPTAL